MRLISTHDFAPSNRRRLTQRDRSNESIDCLRVTAPAGSADADDPRRVPTAEPLLCWGVLLILDPVPTPRIVGKPIQMTRPRPSRWFTLGEVELAVNPRVIAALRQASRGLTEAGARHAVLGAIAVGIHGWPRATSDVDILVAPEAFDIAPDGKATPRVELPEEIDGVAIDYLPIDVAGDFLEESFDRVHVSDGVPIAPVEVVIVTKLIRLAMRDQADIVELVKVGLFDVGAVEAYLELHTPMLTARYRALVEQARRELERGQ